MGRLWCRDLPTVTVPMGEPKRVTLVIPYYCNRLFLRDQIAHWWSFDELVRSFVSAVIVDDGSPEPLSLVGIPQPFPIRLFRIEQDIRWNWLAARNIGAHHADDGWLLMSDIDHVVPESTMRSLVTGAHDERVVYAFQRREHTGEPANPHSASFLMTREMFWRIGGYDERFSGLYGTDGLYRRRVAHTAKMAVLTDHLIRYEYVADSSTTRYARKQPIDAMVRKMASKLPKNAKPKTLTFPYHEVTL